MDKYQKWITKSMRSQTFLPKRDSIVWTYQCLKFYCSLLKPFDCKSKFETIKLGNWPFNKLALLVCFNSVWRLKFTKEQLVLLCSKLCKLLHGSRKASKHSKHQHATLVSDLFKCTSNLPTLNLLLLPSRAQDCVRRLHKQGTKIKTLIFRMKRQKKNKYSETSI